MGVEWVGADRTMYIYVSVCALWHQMITSTYVLSKYDVCVNIYFVCCVCVRESEKGREKIWIGTYVLTYYNLTLSPQTLNLSIIMMWRGRWGSLNSWWMYFNHTASNTFFFFCFTWNFFFWNTKSMWREVMETYVRTLSKKKICFCRWPKCNKCGDMQVCKTNFSVEYDT